LENGYYSLTPRLLRTLPLFDTVVAELAEASA